MSELRRRMLRDMTVRGFSPRTHEAYVPQVIGLARYYRRAPDQLTADEVQAYLAHLFEVRKRSWSTCAQAAHAFRFLYHVTLGHPRIEFHVPAPKQPQKLPDLLSREEVWRILNACIHPRDRVLLATTYAAGLRVSEVVALKVLRSGRRSHDHPHQPRQRCQGSLRAAVPAPPPRCPRLLAHSAATPVALPESPRLAPH